MKFPSFPAESNNLQLATREVKTNPTISYPALPLDQSGEGSGSSTSPYPHQQPPNSSHPFGYGQPSTETHGAGMTTMQNTMLPHLVNQPGQPSTETHRPGMTTMPNTPLPHMVNQPGQPSTETHGVGMTSMLNTTPGSTAMPATVIHTQPSHVAPGTDPLSSRGEGGHPTFRRR